MVRIVWPAKSQNIEPCLSENRVHNSSTAVIGTFDESVKKYNIVETVVLRKTSALFN